MTLGVLFALALDSGMMKLAKFTRLSIFVPYAVPGVIAALMWGYLYGPDFGPFAQGAIEPEEAIRYAARILVDDGIAQPILLGNRVIIEHLAHELGLSLEDIATEDPYSSPNRDRYATSLWDRRQRKGLSLAEANQRLLNPNSPEEVPTFNESGLPGFESVLHYGLLAPAGTPQPIIRRLHDDAVKIIRSKELTQQLQPFPLQLRRDGGQSRQIPTGARQVLNESGTDGIADSAHVFSKEGPKELEVDVEGLPPSVGSDEHWAAIRALGPSPVHRRSFRGVGSYQASFI